MRQIQFQPLFDLAFGADKFDASESEESESDESEREIDLELELPLLSQLKRN